jgi:hypothetical protein
VHVTRHTRTANELKSSDTGSTPNNPRKPFTTRANAAFGPRMIIHAYTRIRKLLQNGRITSSSSRSRCLRSLRAMSEASGYARTRQMSVVAMAYQKDLRKICQYSGSVRKRV